MGYEAEMAELEIEWRTPTAGPWKKYHESSSYFDIGGNEQSAVGLPTGKPGEIAIEPVCRVSRHVHGEANCNLILAARDLLEACKAVIAHVEDMEVVRIPPSQCTLCHEYRMILHAAIAKAEHPAPHEGE